MKTWTSCASNRSCNLRIIEFLNLSTGFTWLWNLFSVLVLIQVLFQFLVIQSTMQKETTWVNDRNHCKASKERHSQATEKPVHYLWSTLKKAPVTVYVSLPIQVLKIS